MRNVFEIIKELEAKRDLEGLKNLRTCVNVQANAEIAWSRYVLSKYSSNTIDRAWMRPLEAPEDLANAINIMYCDECTDIQLDWMDDAIENIIESRKHEATTQAIWEQEFPEEIPERFEDFVEQFSEVYPNEVDIPVDELYERYIYLTNQTYEKLRWQDLLEKEVF